MIFLATTTSQLHCSLNNDFRYNDWCIRSVPTVLFREIVYWKFWEDFELRLFWHKLARGIVGIEKVYCANDCQYTTTDSLSFWISNVLCKFGHIRLGKINLRILSNIWGMCCVVIYRNLHSFYNININTVCSMEICRHIYKYL